MGKRRGYLVLLGALAGALLLGLVERGSASTTGPECADRPFCVTLVDQDEQSRSVESAHYMKYELTISRDPDGGTSQLTNGGATLTLIDVIGEDDAITTDPDDPVDVPSNAVFQEDPSDQRCSAGAGQSKHIITCAVPNFPAGSPDLVYAPLIFTTTNRTEAASPFTKSLAFVTFKERGSDNQPTDPNTDAVTVVNETEYEPNDDLDSSWAFRNATINLATSSTADDQHTKFGFTVPNGENAPAFTGFVAEHPLTSALNPCGTNTCYGEIVETNTAGHSGDLFSKSKPVNVIVTWDFLPSGKTRDNIVGYHRRDGASSPETLTDPCILGSDGLITNLPCRDVTIKRLGQGRVEVTISMKSDGNGGWGVG